MLHGLKIFSRFQIDLFPFGELHITSSTDINPTSQPSFYFKLPLFLILILLIFFLEEPWHKASSMPLRQKKKFCFGALVLCTIHASQGNST